MRLGVIEFVRKSFEKFPVDREYCCRAYISLWLSVSIGSTNTLNALDNSYYIVAKSCRSESCQCNGVVYSRLCVCVCVSESFGLAVYWVRGPFVCTNDNNIVAYFGQSTSATGYTIFHTYMKRKYRYLMHRYEEYLVSNVLQKYVSYSWKVADAFEWANAT